MVNLADLTRLHLKSEHLHGSADAEFDPLLTRQGMADAQLAVRAYTRGSGEQDTAIAAGKCPREQATDPVD